MTGDRRRRIRERLQLTHLALGGLSAQALFAANEVGLFGTLARLGPSTAEELARDLDVDADATGRLLGALTALELVEHDGDRFRNSAAAERHLVPGASESMTAWVSLVGRWARNMADLPTSLRTGEPVQDPEEHLGRSEAYTSTFIRGMHDYAVGLGRELARHLDLSGRRRLLDVGGGPATYSVLLAEANPELECVVFDLAPVLRVAEEIIAEWDLTGRVSTTPGDYHHDELPGGYDVILISNTLHQEDRATCLQILRNAHAALEPSGLLVIQAMFLNDRGDGPLWPTLHNLVLQVVYSGGRAYTVRETRELLAEAGFGEATHHQMSTFNAGSYLTVPRH